MKKLLLSFLFLVVATGVQALEVKPTEIKDATEPVACTMDAKVCPDGSAVGRTAPNCEFAPCPGEEVLPEPEPTPEPIPAPEPEPEIPLLERIRKAKTEQERVAIFQATQQPMASVQPEMLVVEPTPTPEPETVPELIEEPIVEEDDRSQIVAEKSAEIFTTFDTIISKLKEVVTNIKSQLNLLKEAGLDITTLETSLSAIDSNILTVETHKAEAWLLMQKTIELEDKEAARENLESVKILLHELKDEIKSISEETKGIIANMKVMIGE